MDWNGIDGMDNGKDYTKFENGVYLAMSLSTC